MGGGELDTLSTRKKGERRERLFFHGYIQRKRAINLPKEEQYKCTIHGTPGGSRRGGDVYLILRSREEKTQQMFEGA